MCKWECARYLDRLRHDFHSEYTPLRVTLEDGKVFADAYAFREDGVSTFRKLSLSL